MEQKKINPLIRLFPSLTDVAFLMPVATLFLALQGAKTMLGDGDTGWHVRTGEWILANGRVPAVDMFSYTRAGQPWFAWEWLWDVIFGWMHMHWGMESVVLGSILVLCVTFALLFRLAVRQSGNVLIATALTFVAMAASTIHWLARPHLFTLLFTVVFLSVLERVREGRERLLWTLPPVALVWTSLHGGFFVGIALVGCYAAGEWIRALLADSAEERRQAFRQSLPYLWCSIACAAVSFVNPYGYRLHQHLFEYLGDPYHRQHITEFMSASFNPGSARFFELLLAGGTLAAYGCVREKRYASAVLIALWAHLALVAARNIPLFAIVATPVMAEYLAKALRTLAESNIAGWVRSGIAAVEQMAREIGEVDRIGRVHLTCLLSLAGVALVLFSPAASGKWKAEYDRKVYPEAAIQALSSEALASRIFTDDEWGDYLIYRLYPSGRVFVDGRSDFYGAELGNAFLDALNVAPKWKQTFTQYGVQTVLLPCRSPLSGALKESAQWQAIYDDGIAIVFRPVADRSPDGTRFAGIHGETQRGRETANRQQP